MNPRAGLDVSERAREQEAEILALKLVVCKSTTAECNEAKSVTVQHSSVEKTGK